MNKYLLFISILLISTFFIGAVSAENSYNISDDSVIAMPSADADDELFVDEIDNLKVNSQIDDVNEEPNLLKEMNNRSDEVLSDGDASNTKPTVTVGEITFKPGNNLTVEVNVADSDGKPISGNIIAMLYGENNILMKNVKLDNGTGELNINITEILGVMSTNTGSITDVYDILSSSINFNDMNISKIINGLKDISNVFSINISNVTDSVNNIINGSYVNITEFNEGLNLIKNAFSINITTIKEGINDVINGIDINTTGIQNISLKNFNFTEIAKMLNISSDDLNSIISDLANNISEIISFNKTAFVDGLNNILNEFNITDNDINNFMNYLNFTGELQDKINNILDGKNLNLTYLIQAFREVIDYNLTIKDIINGLDNITNLTISDALNKIFESIDTNYTINLFENITGINVTKLIEEGFKFNATNTVSEIIKSINTTYNKLLNSIINSTQIFENITKLSNIFAGLVNISNEISFNASDFLSGIKKLYSEFNFTMADVNGILNAITFNETTAILEDILNDLNITNTHIIQKFVKFREYLNLSFTDKFTDFITNIVLGKNFNITEFISALTDLMDKNNLSIIDIIDALDNVSDGIIFNSSKLIEKINASNINMSKITNHLFRLIESISLDYNKTLNELSNIINRTNISDALNTMLNSFKFNETAINNTLENIYKELNLNTSAINSILEKLNITNSAIISDINKLMSSFSFNTTVIGDGITKIIESFKINSSILDEGIVKIIDSIKIDFAGIIKNASNIINSFSCNDTAALNGINKIINGLGINTSKILTQIISKFGNGAILSFVFIPNNIISFDFKTPTRIDASKVSITYGNSGNIVISLNDIFGSSLNGKTVSVSLNGKTYTGVTNSKGQVSISISEKLNPKTYDASVSFAGDDDYAKSTSSVKVVVGKLTPKITAKAKTFKSSVKTKKYTIVLKTNKNKSMKKKKVSLKVNGKTYVAKTNAKGKATFKITKLTKKGTYKAVVSYKGNAYYSKISKKLKITVK